MTALALIAVGLGTGILSATLGIGGGIVFVPALVALFGFDQHLAEGTSLLVIVPTALIGTMAHARAGRVDWKIGLLVGAGGVVGGFAGAHIALELAPAVLRRLFAAFLAVMALRMLWRTRSAAVRD